jgi:hypothetical protein
VDICNQSNPEGWSAADTSPWNPFKGDQAMRGYVLSLALILGLPALASASQIGVGLDGRQNVFVQEFWQDGKARYAICNNRPEAIKLTVSDVQFVNVPGTESFRAIEGKELVSWDVKGKEVLFVEAPKVLAGDGLRFLRFRIADGAPLGLLSLPTAPADLPKGKIVSYDGMNGSGGRRQNVFFEQDSLTFKSDGVIEVRLKLPAGGETVTFKKAKSIDAPVEALIIEVQCDTLAIQISKEAITIDTTKPLKVAPVHAVTLRFKAPRVDVPTMAAIDGWVTLAPAFPGAAAGSYHVIRGVIVQPEK